MLRGGSMAKLYETPIKAIRKKCLDCCCGQPKEVRLCPKIDCANYPYRMGTRPSEETIKTLEDYLERDIGWYEYAIEILEKPKKQSIKK